jgi:hypothetical protein
MRQIINLNDLKNNSVVGKWVIELDEKDVDLDIIRSKNDGFWLEKRISFVGRIDTFTRKFLKEEYKDEPSLIILNGIYYSHGIYTQENFVHKFNNTYLKDEGKEGRFLRFLTSREMDWLNSKLKEQRS